MHTQQHGMLEHSQTWSALNYYRRRSHTSRLCSSETGSCGLRLFSARPSVLDTRVVYTGGGRGGECSSPQLGRYDYNSQS